ncbi:MAG TPA: hypothetical protein VMS21_08835 [Methylomirabilota bacterium]|nr:hypothetical protein [Methylomirabilota bacterium]
MEAILEHGEAVGVKGEQAGGADAGGDPLIDGEVLTAFRYLIALINGGLNRGRSDGQEQQAAAGENGGSMENGSMDGRVGRGTAYPPPVPSDARTISCLAPWLTVDSATIPREKAVRREAFS